MKQLFIIIATLFTTTFTFAQKSSDIYVDGYYKTNGTYVEPHYRTAPNSTINDNYSTYPNVNPYTGKTGTKTPNYTPSLNSSSLWNTSNNNSSNSSYWNTPTYSKPRRGN